MSIYENKKLAVALSFLNPISRTIAMFQPNLETELKQSNFNVKKESFISIALFNSLIYGVLLCVSFYLIFYALNQLNENTIMLSFVVPIIITIFSFFSSLNVPKLQVYKKVKSIDDALLFALRHILIKIRSGIPFYDSMVSVAYSNYGFVSQEFKKAVKDIQGGTSDIEALEKISFMNPSHYFRKFIWQVTNSMRAGNDLEKTVEVIVKSLEDDRYVKIKEFSNKLSPIALMYIMFTIIFPSMTITLMSVTSVFFSFEISSMVFLIIPFVLLIFNLFFMSVISSNLPSFNNEW